jgi:pimeloyl-ACP methyl ester carboxylesterase
MKVIGACAAGICLMLSAAISCAQDKFFDSNGVSIRYVEQGAGEPIVLIHGTGQSANIWVRPGLVKEFAATNRVIALDLRGHGKSGKPHDPAKYGREMGLDVIRLLDHLKIQRAHLVGFSLGGNLTSQLLVLHPERFLSATLVAGAGYFAWPPELERETEQDATERETECVSRTLMIRLAPPDEPKPTEEYIKARSADCLANPDQDRFALAAMTRSRRELVIPPAQAAAVKVPTLGIVGTLDSTHQRHKTLKELRPTTTLVFVEGATHLGDRGILARPELAAALRRFIAEN